MIRTIEKLNLHIDRKHSKRVFAADVDTRGGMEQQYAFCGRLHRAVLFKQLRTSLGYKAIVGKEEVSQFFEQILGVKNKNRLDVRRLTQLSHGATWVYTRGDKSARQV